MSNVKFNETQHFNRTLLLILGAAGLMTIIRGMMYLVGPESSLMNAFFLFSVTLCIAAAIWWLRRLELKVSITEKNIKYKMSPIHKKKKSIPWSEVDNYEIIKTSEAAQWSGGNITFNHEKRFSLNGRNGIALTTKSGEQYFIGCKDLPQLRRTLRAIR